MLGLLIGLLLLAAITGIISFGGFVVGATLLLVLKLLFFLFFILFVLALIFFFSAR